MEALSAAAEAQRGGAGGEVQCDEGDRVGEKWPFAAIGGVMVVAIVRGLVLKMQPKCCNSSGLPLAFARALCVR